MAYRCPVCKQTASTVSKLAEHIMNSQDNSHGKWLESYCNSNNIDFARMILEQINGNKDTSKSLIKALKRDFCKD